MTAIDEKTNKQVLNLVLDSRRTVRHCHILFNQIEEEMQASEGDMQRANLLMMELHALWNTIYHKHKQIAHLLGVEDGI